VPSRRTPRMGSRTLIYIYIYTFHLAIYAGNCPFCKPVVSGWLGSTHESDCGDLRMQVIEIGNHERPRPPAVDEATAWRQATWQTSYRSGASAAPRTVAPRPTNTCVRGFCNLARMQSMDIWRWRVSQWTSGGGAAAICTCQVNMQCTLFINFADCACTSCVDVPTVTRPAAQDAAI
jgi:hypothetical protein